MARNPDKRKQPETPETPAEPETRETGREQPAPPAPEEIAEETPEPNPTPETDLQAERDSLLARLQRVTADYMNYQKRVQKDTESARQFANESLMKALLDVLDDMERGLEAARANHPADDPLLVGMQMIHDKAMQVLGKFGLEPIEAEGRPFDPERHQAMMQEPTDEVPPMTVLREVQKGYQLKGRTLRPSGVVVSKTPESPETEETE